jgi:amino acid adenylation domain-containing protein
MTDSSSAAVIESLPLSPEQRWAKDAKAVVLHARLEGVLDPDRFRDALQFVIGRHAVFAQSFQIVAGYRSLRMLPLTMPRMPVWCAEDWREPRPGTWTGLLEEAHKAAFDFGAGITVKAWLLRTGDAEWQFILSAAPLVADRQSLIQLLNETIEALEDHPLEDAFQYTQFVVWRQELEADAEEGRSYWSSFLREPPAPPHLPFRTALVARGHRSISQLIDADRLVSLAAYARDKNIALEAIAQAAWWFLLARLSGNHGYAAAWLHDCRRDYEPMADGIGVFEKLLPLHITLDLEGSFQIWLERWTKVLDAHREAQEFWPVEDPPQRGHLHFGFAFTELPGTQDRALKWRLAHLSEPCSVCELTLDFAYGSVKEEAEISLHYDAARYRQEALQRLLEQYIYVLGEVAERSHLALKDLPIELVPAAPALEGAKVDFGPELLPQRIARFAREAPDEEALRCGEIKLSYAQLDRRVAGLAGWLREQGAGPGAIIALTSKRSVELIVALLAIWRVGAAYVPLDPNWPAARREAVLADARPLLILDETNWKTGEGVDSAQPFTARKVDLAYLLYTSGSTGAPKGVAVGHGQLANYVAAASETMNLGESGHWAMIGSIAADLGNTALFGALANGACLVVAQDADLESGDAFSGFLSKQAIDGLKIVPSQLEALLEGLTETRLPKTLVLGGEPLPFSLIRKVHALSPDCRIYNHYGPTETTIGVMIHAIDASSAQEEDFAPLTAALPNCRVYVLDERLKPVPVGALGELCVGGSQLARYTDAEAQGAYIDDPFLPGERLYRSGDLACRLAEGGLRILGRMDQQVKIRGFRVEPAEIEQALGAQSGVRQAVVMAREGQLCAYLVADDGLDGESGRQILRAELLNRLPDYMVPAHFIFVESFPRLESGKIDRRTLTTLKLAEAGSAHGLPSDALEAFLCHSMCELLKRQSIGTEEDFFDLGGHSLLVIKLLARIRQSLELDIPPSVFFDFATPKALATALRRHATDVDRLEKLASLGKPVLIEAAPSGVREQEAL